LAIAGAAECLEVAEVVGAALGEGNDVVYFKFFGAAAMLSRLRMYARTSGGILMRGDFFGVMAID
jgi:hypothetical protein